MKIIHGDKILCHEIGMHEQQMQNQNKTLLDRLVNLALIEQKSRILKKSLGKKSKCRKNSQTKL